MAAAYFLFGLLLLALEPGSAGQWWYLALGAVGTLGLCWIARRKMRSWLILFAVGLSLAPGLDCLLVLLLRRAGDHAFLTGTPFSVDTQTNPVLAGAATATFLFVLGLGAGWLLVAHRLRGVSLDLRMPMTLPVRFLLGGVWLFCLVSFYQEVGGRTILAAQYGSSTGEAVFYSGMYAVVANLSLMVLDASIRHRSQRSWINALWGVNCLALLLLGNRVDVIFALILILLVRFRSFGTQVRVAVLACAVLVPFFVFWGFFRSMASFDLHRDNLISYFLADATTRLPTVGGIGPAALTTADAVFLQRSHRLEELQGSGYWDYLERTMPLALMPTRPPSLALSFSQYGLPTLGGLTPVAEALLNFPLGGALAVGLVMGLLLALFELRVCASANPWIHAAYVVAVAISFRTWMYEVFSLYKLLVVYAAFAAICALAVRATMQRGSTRQSNYAPRATT